MTARLIVLTDKAFSDDLSSRLALADRAVTLTLAFTSDELKTALSQSMRETRLISFGSSVIVPAEMLGALPGPSFNFHPGPPEYRGLFPSVFALYDRAATFGVTCHEMTNEIDSGPIVAVERFTIPPDANRERLDALTYVALLKMVERLAPQFANVTRSLAHVTASWFGPVRRRADFESLCRLPPNVDEAEFQRRYRAIGEGPHHALSIELHGQTFLLDNRRSGLRVVRGGRDIAER